MSVALRQPGCHPHISMLSRQSTPSAPSRRLLVSANHSRLSSHLTPRKRDGRARLSAMFIPTGAITGSATEDAYTKLVRASILRQAHSGIFHLLPLGLRIMEKLEKLIDEYMIGLGASKVALSSLSSQGLWSKSGRLDAYGSELFRLNDRKEAGFLLSPTHEEEITTLVASTVQSYRHLPVRLYQICKWAIDTSYQLTDAARKYRDELRPRHGLLRAREFVMKDLYTFDLTEEDALATYEDVRRAYYQLFTDLKVPFLVAEADSGAIGGNLSHEFHFPTQTGEDHIINCESCGYVANEELAEPARALHEVTNVGQRWTFEPAPEAPTSSSGGGKVSVWRGVSRDGYTLVNVWYPSQPGVEVNAHAVKKHVPNLDSGVKNATVFWTKNLALASQEPAPPVPEIINLVDHKLPASFANALESDPEFPVHPAGENTGYSSTVLTVDASTDKPLDLLRITDGDQCPRCDSGKLRVRKAIELGHTFHLGTKYSAALGATVMRPNKSGAENGAKNDNSKQSAIDQVAMQMGCHGIGVSRIIGAVADILADDKGLNWPRVIAPYEVAVVPVKDHAGAEMLYDLLSKTPGEEETLLDVVLDDRDKHFPWKMHDADIIGYPIIVVAGKGLAAEKPTCEVQCRRLGFKDNVSLDNVRGVVESLLAQL